VCVCCINAPRSSIVILGLVFAVCTSVLQCVAMCCSVLQCVAVCCSELLRVPVCCNRIGFAVCMSVSHDSFKISSNASCTSTQMQNANATNTTNKHSNHTNTTCKQLHKHNMYVALNQTRTNNTQNKNQKKRMELPPLPRHHPKDSGDFSNPSLFCLRFLAARSCLNDSKCFERQMVAPLPLATSPVVLMMMQCLLLLFAGFGVGRRDVSRNKHTHTCIHANTHRHTHTHPHTHRHTHTHTYI